MTETANASLNFCAMVRAMVSLGPPAAKGDTMVMDLLGKVCAQLDCHTKLMRPIKPNFIMNFKA